MSHAKVRKSLLNRRAELLGAIRERDDFVAQNTIDEEEDKSFERLEDEVLSAVSDSDREEIQLIELALGKIEDGSYGICENCGRDIAPARLEALPHAILCIDCASAAEVR